MTYDIAAEVRSQVIVGDPARPLTLAGQQLLLLCDILDELRAMRATGIPTMCASAEYPADEPPVRDNGIGGTDSAGPGKI